MAHVDRAILDGEEGFARVHVEKKSGRVLGATLVASHAGEMIGETYPTQAEIWKRLGDAWNRARLTPRVRGLFERYLRWKR